jgi:metalloprotease
MHDDQSVLSRRQIMAFLAVAGGISSVTPLHAQFGSGALGKIGKGLGAAKDLSDAQSLTDAELKGYFDQIAVDMDRQNPVATMKDPYGKRIAKLSQGLKNHDGLALDIKAYLVTDVNAFAMANGTIRVFGGLMDKFTDDEIRYVIGHEIGHVKRGHTKKRMQAALRASALGKAASAAGGTVGRIADSDLTKFFNKVISSQHSQSNENEADDYAMGFMKTKKYPAAACVSALDKLAAMSGPGGAKWLSTHPSPQARSARMKAQLTA